LIWHILKLTSFEEFEDAELEQKDRIVEGFVVGAFLLSGAEAVVD
jgi:hypothetical protein